LSRTLNIWDSQDQPPTACDDEIVYTWNGYSENGNTRSLFKFIENNDDLIRSKYLAWVYELGAYKIKNKKVSDYFSFNDGFSYWWMTLFVEKSPWTQPSIIDAIRLFALNEIINKEKPEIIHLVSANHNLHQIIKGICKQSVINYNWVKSPKIIPASFGLKNIYHILPLPVQSFFEIFRYLYKRWPLRKMGKMHWESGEKSIFFCSYFFSLDTRKLSEGHFYSRQWEELPSLINRMGLSQNWLQIFYAHAGVPNSSRAVEITEILNKQNEINGVHTFVDSFLSIHIFFKVLVKYFKLQIAKMKLRQIKNAFIPFGTHFSLWPIMKNDWHRTISSPLAINNLFFLELFDKALSTIPKQPKGVYLFENLSWESAFIHKWRKYGHGKLIAVAHSTVRYWDTRYFFDPRAINAKLDNPLPQADFYALNGNAAIDNFINAGFPKEKIVSCEALRYLNFNEIVIQNNKIKLTEDSLRIIILGDYMPAGTNNMLKLISKAISSFSRDVSLSIKPHPNYQIDPNDFPNLNLTVVNNQLYSILPNYDIAISSNMTSASVDAALAGLPVIIVLEDVELNFSPLRGNSNVFFVSHFWEIAEVINKFDKGLKVSIGLNNFFFLDPELPRWKKILES
jgi:surface carbohydrate biosynthesis protein (TIGR04326 family)